MTGHEMMMMALCILPFVVVGWVGGMLFMRWQYIEWQRRDHKTIRRQDRIIRQLQGRPDMY